jgi:uncharacterized protein (DUF1800 family)
MLNNSQLKIRHLYNRAGFGISYNELNARKHQKPERAVDDLFGQSQKVEPLSLDFSFMNRDQQPLADEEKRRLQQMGRDGVRDLNTVWIRNMADSRQPLREKLTLFWHGHFACRTQNPAFAQELNNIHRKHALGNFRTLVTEVSQSPAMLQFLNNQQNRKGRPNENFARELMELFTLGRGNYTERDVKESARAFTGWMYGRSGTFEFRPMVHDSGPKTFFGQTGNFDGTDIIRMILEKPEAAEFIAGKLYGFLVNDRPDAARVRELGRYFYEKDYDISALVRKIVTAPWFYEPANVASRIKSPAEFLVMLTRQFGVQYQNPTILLQFQNALGQTLFYPPNVAGWSGGKNWIDSSSLMVRLKLPSAILNSGEIEFGGKADPDDEAEIAQKRAQRQAVQRRVATIVNWDGFLSQFRGRSSADVIDFLLPAPPRNGLAAVLQKEADLRAAAIEAISLPEYQLI